MKFKKIWDFLEDEYNRRKDEYGNEKCTDCSTQMNLVGSLKPNKYLNSYIVAVP